MVEYIKKKKIKKKKKINTFGGFSSWRLPKKNLAG